MGKKGKKSLVKLIPHPSEKVPRAKAKTAKVKPPAVTDSKLEALVREIIKRVADKMDDAGAGGVGGAWCSAVHSAGGVGGGREPEDVLTKTVRQMERDGLVTRTVHPVIPPRVEYELTELGRSLGEAFCGVWIWAERRGREIERARVAFKERV